jgi:hypothetical protein
VGTIAYYGPDDKRATKVAVGIIPAEDAKPSALERWHSEAGDIRLDSRVENEILRFLRLHGAKSIALKEGIFGCPHEEGIDYPDGEVCPQCPFWANRER